MPSILHGTHVCLAHAKFEINARSRLMRKSRCQACPSLLSSVQKVATGNKPCRGHGPRGAAHNQHGASWRETNLLFRAVALRQISAVVSLQVEENSWVLHQTTLRISGSTDLSIDALFAPFSFRPTSSVSGPLVFADPPTAHDALVKNSDVRGR